MKNCLLPLIATVFAIAGCVRHSEEWQTILDVENYIESRPDSALAVLGSIDTEQLSGPEEKAKHAVLMSMALDKNYVDKTEFDVLQPAIDWHENHGSPTDRLRTFYYQGCIYLNCGDKENAMKCFVKALDAGKRSDDILTKARDLFLQGKIYGDLYNWDKTIEANLSAAQYFQESGLTNSYVNCLLRVINGYTIQKDYGNALKYAENCKTLLADIRMSLVAEFYAVYLIMIIQSKESEETITEVIAEYLNSVPQNMLDWHTISYAYYSLKDYNNALIAISRLGNITNTDDRIRHYAILSQIYQNAGNYKEALDAYDRYISIKDSVEFAIFQQDTQFVEERHVLEVKAIKERATKNYTMLASAILLIFAAGSGIWNRNRLKISRMEKQMADSEAERYRLLYIQMEEERDNLNALIEKKENIDPKVMAAISSRLELLNKFFTAHITANGEIDRKASEEMKELLSDKDKFMQLTRLVFTGSKPEFISYLEGKKLTEQEINYCCLYAIGLKGKEVGAYIRLKGHYNVSSAIREKLGIGEHDTNLGIYIKHIINMTSKQTTQTK